MKNLELTTWERMQLVECVPERGFTRDLRKYLRLLDILELTPEERGKVGWTETPVIRQGLPVINPHTGMPVVGVTVGQPQKTFELAFEDADLDLLVKLVGLRETWPFKGLDGQRTEALLDKLEQDDE